MSGRIDWNIVTLGRLAGLGIIVAGIILAALDASALSDAFVGSHAKVRYFLHDATGFAWKGGLVFAAAEIADRFGWGGRRWIDWQGTRLLHLLGLAVIVVGIGATVWDMNVLPGGNLSTLTRIYLRSIIGALWSGGVLLLAAAIADRIGWPDSNNELAAEAPA